MVLDQIQDFLEPYRLWVLVSMLAIGMVSGLVPQLAALSFVSAILAAVLAIYLISWGLDAVDTFQQAGFVGLTGFALIGSGVGGISMLFSQLGPLSGLGSAFALPVSIIGGGLLFAALLGAIRAAK